MGDPLENIDREGEVAIALERHTGRKEAADIDARQMEGMEKVRLGFSGTDLDLEELLTFKDKILGDAAGAAASGIPLAEIIFGMWIDGVALGVTIEQGRDG